MDALAQRLGTRSLDSRQSIAQHGREDIDHLSIPIVGSGQLATDPLDAGGEDPFLERRPVAQRSRLVGQHGNVVPGVIDRLVAPEAAGVITDEATVLAQLDAIGIGADRREPSLASPVGFAIRASREPDQPTDYTT
jgi:hypothetical protein